MHNDLWRCENIQGDSNNVDKHTGQKQIVTSVVIVSYVWEIAMFLVTAKLY